MNTISFYKNDADFKRYVDKYAVQRGITPEEALKHQLVLNYQKYLLEKKGCKSSDLITFY